MLACCLLLGSAANSVAQSVRPAVRDTYASSTWLTPKDFVDRLSAVAVTLDVQPSLLQYVSADAVRAGIVRHLAARGIAAQATAPVRLRVQISHRRATYTASRVSSTSGAARRVSEEPVQQLVVWLRFELTTAVLRQDTFRLVDVVPADGYSMRVWSQEREPLAARLPEEIDLGLQAAVASAATNDEPAEPAHWRGSTWSPAVALAMHTRFVAALNSGRREPTILAGIDTEPEIAVFIGDAARRFVSRTDVEAMWRAQFTHLGLPSRPTTEFYVDHRIFAVYDDASTASRIWGVEGLPFYHLSDVVILNQKDVVYRLNGAFYRSDVQLRAWTSSGFSLLGETRQALDQRVAAAVQQFGREVLASR